MSENCVKTRVAIVISDLNFGGAQTMVTRLAKAIDKDKFEICVFIRDGARHNSIEAHLANAKINCIFMNIGENEKHRSKLVHKVKSFLRIQCELNKYKPDIIHVHLEMFYTFLYGIINSIPLVMTIHSQPERIATRRLRCMLYLLNKHHLISIVGSAKCATEKAKQYLIDSPDVLYTIYNPIVLDNYGCNLEKTNIGFTYLHIARLEPIKNQPLLLQAFAKVLAVYPESKLLIAGGGGELEILRKLAKKLGIEGAISFLGNRDDIATLLSNSDAFVLSSDSEVCPMTVLEALASGIPVVSTDVGGVRELVGEDAGILVPKGNVWALFEAMIEIQKESEKRTCMSQNAIKRAQMFDSQEIAKAYELLYQNNAKQKS